MVKYVSEAGLVLMMVAFILVVIGVAVRKSSPQVTSALYIAAGISVAIGFSMFFIPLILSFDKRRMAY